MSVQPQTDPKGHRQAVVPDRWTDIEVLNPAIALLDAEARIAVLLAKSVLTEPHGTVLLGVNLIRVPWNSELTFMRWMSRFTAVYLPDELLFDRLDLVESYGRYSISVPGRKRPMTPRRDSSFALKPLTEAGYTRLATELGRDLLADLLELFSAELAEINLARFEWARRVRVTPRPFPA